MDIKEIFKYINTAIIIEFYKKCRASQEKKQERAKQEPETVYDEYIGPFSEEGEGYEKENQDKR